MKITDIKMTKVEEDFSRVLAKFDVVFDNCFAVHNISLVKALPKNSESEEKKEAFIGFYSLRDTNGKYINICHPINSEFRNYVEDTLIEFYNNN